MFNRNKNKTPSSNNDDNDNNNDASSTANTPSSLHPPSSTPPSSSSTGNNNKVVTTDRVSDATGRQEEGEFRPLRGAFIDGPLSSPLSNESSSNKQAINTTDSPNSTNAGGIASTSISISKGKDTATVTSKGSFLSSMGGLLKRNKDSTKSTTSSPPLQTQTGEVSNTHDTVDKDTSKANSSIIVKGSDKDSSSASERPCTVDGGKEEDRDPPIQDGPKLSNASLVHSDSYNNNKEGTKTTKGVGSSVNSTMNTGLLSPAAAMGTNSSSSTTSRSNNTAVDAILPKKKKEDLLSMGTEKKASIDPLVIVDSSMTAVNRNSATATTTIASPHIGPKSSTSPTTIPSKKMKKDETAAVEQEGNSVASQASRGASNSASVHVGIVDHKTTTGMQRVAADILLADTYNTTTTSTSTTGDDHIHIDVGKGNDRSDTVLHATTESSRVESQSLKESSHALTSASSTAATTIDVVDSRGTVTATTINSTAIIEKDDERKVMRIQMEQLLRDGDVSSRKGQHVESCLAFEGCLQLFKKLDDKKEEKAWDSMLLARIHNGLAMAYYNLGKGGR